AMGPAAIPAPTAGTPFIGTFRPEAGNFSIFDGLTPADLNGDWKLEISDFRNNGANLPPQFLSFWDVKFLARMSTTGFGTDKPIAARPTIITTGGGGARGATYPLTTTASAATGIGPWYSIAVDNTLGSFSQFQGRIYLAFTTGGGSNTNVFLVSSDNSGTTWSQPVQVHDDSFFDFFSEGNRPQFH